MSRLAKQATKVFFGSAVAGAGLSFGRDFYRRGKGDFLTSAFTVLIIFGIFGAFYLPYRAGKEMIKGHRRGKWATFFKTFVVNGIWLGLGYLIWLVIAAGLDKAPEPNPHKGAFIFTAGCFVAGILVGFVLRIRRKKAFAVEEDNEKFLAEHGFQDTESSQYPYIDGEGNKLRLEDATKKQLTFMVVGRRGQRAFIDLDKTGRMTSYSGAMKVL